MVCSTIFHRALAGRRVVAGLLVLVVLAATAAPVLAQADSLAFSVRLSEKEKTLSDPGNGKLQNFLMWDLGADRVMARSMPYVELRNDAAINAPITEFRMTIGDTRFHFDCQMLKSCALLGKTTPGISLSSSVANGGNELVLSLGNGGLDPGEVVRFKIALGVDPAHSGFFAHPDFRTVLFDMNGVNVYDGMQHTPSNVDGTLDNSALTVKFRNGSVTETVGPVRLDDYSVTSLASLYFNNNFRRYGVMEPVESFLMIGGGGVIPEPASALLLVFGLLALAWPLARARRKALAPVIG